MKKKTNKEVPQPVEWSAFYDGKKMTPRSKITVGMVMVYAQLLENKILVRDKEIQVLRDNLEVAEKVRDNNQKIAHSRLLETLEWRKNWIDLRAVLLKERKNNFRSFLIVTLMYLLWVGFITFLHFIK